MFDSLIATPSAEQAVGQAEQLLTGFAGEMQTITSNNMLSAEGKAQRAAKARESFVPAAEKQIATIWGQPTVENGVITLSNGAAWVDLEAANKAIATAKSKAEGAIDAQRLLAAKFRAESALQSARTPDDVVNLYLQSSTDVIAAFQEYGGLLLKDRQDMPGENWSGVVARFERDRTQRITTPDVLKAYERHASVVRALDRAYQLTGQLAQMTAAKPHLTAHTLIGKIHGMIERYQDTSPAIPGEKPVKFYNYRRRVLPGQNVRGG